MKRSARRGIPSVDRLMRELGASELPRALVVDVVRRELSQLRKQKTIPAFAGVVAGIHGALGELSCSRIQPVINGTGIIIHTNLGRVPIATAAIEALTAIASNYCNLEYDLSGGTRGTRASYLERSLAMLCGAEAATVVNNNAASLILILRHICERIEGDTGRLSSRKTGETTPVRNEVIISRGELIQIGGGFRIPDILESSGARIREVGTTNKTSLDDYARAISRRTAMILKVHRSNFFMEGFVDSPRPSEIAGLARRNRVPFVEDLGSGAMVETEGVAELQHEPMPAEVLKAGVDLVCFSGDKLLGGPQAGIIAGKARMIAALKREPLFRALRCDKLVLTALEATADSYLRSYKTSAGDESLSKEVPVLEMLRASNDGLRLRAEAIISALAQNNASVKANVGESRAQLGGGALPRSDLASVTVDLTHSLLQPQELAARLRMHRIPIIGYVAQGKLHLDMRAIFPRQDAEVIRAIQAIPA